MENNMFDMVFATSELVQEVLKESGGDLSNPKVVIIDETIDLVQTCTRYLNKVKEVGYEEARDILGELMYKRQNIISHALKLQAYHLSIDAINNKNYIIQIGKSYGFENIIDVIDILFEIGGRTIRIIDDLFDPNCKGIKGYKDVIDKL